MDRRIGTKTRSTVRLTTMVLPLLAGMWLVQGCAAPRNTDVAAFLKVHEHAASGGQRRVRPGDSIHVSATLAEEVDGAKVRVREDGKITLRLVGDVRVAGLSPKEVGAKLEQLLARYYVGAKISVQLMGQRYYYMFGQVNTPGARPYTGHDTIFDAVSGNVGSFLRQTDRVRIIRPSAEPGKQKEFTVNVDKMVYEGDLSENVLLAEGDIIYVPPTAVAAFEMKVRELLFPITPVTRVAGLGQLPTNLEEAALGDDDDDDDDD